MVSIEIEETLSALRSDLAEHGDRVVMFVPYIPLLISGCSEPPADCVRYGSGYARADEVAYAERVNASDERCVRASEMIRTLSRFLQVMGE